jgi:hypothetical protein
MSAVVVSPTFSAKHRSRVAGSDMTRPNCTASGSDLRRLKPSAILNCRSERRRSALVQPTFMVLAFLSPILLVIAAATRNRLSVDQILEIVAIFLEETELAADFRK